MGVVLVPQKAFWDLELYRWWVYLGVERGEWPVLSGDWVYPAGAIVPMVVAGVGGVGGGSGYGWAWAGLVTLLDAAALGVLLHAPRIARPRGADASFGAVPLEGSWSDKHGVAHERRTLLGAWWWIAFLLVLGPIAMGRLDAVVAPLVVAALAVTLRHPRVSSVLLTLGAWVKVAPGAVLLAVVAAVRRPWRDVVVPAALVSVGVVGVTVALGGAEHVLSFLSEQGERGLQIEAPGATPWLVAGLWSSSVVRYLNQPIVTWEIRGPGTHVAADALGTLFPIGLVACGLLLWWCRRRYGARFWSDGVAQRELVVRGALLVVLAMLVLNKVGSPQYMGWLAPPVAVALALRLPGWRTTAWWVLGIGAATQVVFPWGYDEVLAARPGVTLVLAARNVALVVLLVLTVRALLRPPAHAALAAAEETAAVSDDETRDPGDEPRTLEPQPTG